MDGFFREKVLRFFEVEREQATEAVAHSDAMRMASLSQSLANLI